jgi:hypothetical protein
MKITSLSEQQRRADARRSVLALAAYPLMHFKAAPLSARRVTAARDVIAWSAAVRDERRTPPTANTCATRAPSQRDTTTPFALNRAEDDGWPATRGD